MCGDTDFEVYDAHLRIFQKSTDPRGSFDRLGPRVRWFHVPNVASCEKKKSTQVTPHLAEKKR